MSSFSQVKQEIERATSMIARALQDLEAGGVVDLSNLEERIDLACAEATKLPTDEGKSLKSDMVALISDLDQLSESITRHHAELKSNLQQMGTRHRAVTAYGKGPAEKK